MWNDIRDIVIDEGPLMLEHLVTSHSDSTPQLSNYLINLQKFSTTQFEARPIVHMRALLALIKRMGYDMEERLAPAERHGQLDLSIVGYLQIVSELPSDCGVVLNLQEFNCLVSKTFVKLYPAVARYTRRRPFSFEDLLELSHLVVHDPSNILSREPRFPDSCSSESIRPSFPSSDCRSLQDTATYCREVRRSHSASKPLTVEPPAADSITSPQNVSVAPNTRLPPP